MKQIVNAIAKDWISEKIATPPPQTNDSRDCGKNERWPYFSKWMYEQAKNKYMGQCKVLGGRSSVGNEWEKMGASCNP